MAKARRIETHPIVQLVALLRPTFHAVYRAVELNLEGTGVSAPMRGLLERLLDDRPKTVPELARILQIPRQFALKLTTELESKQLVFRHPNPAHKKSDFVSLTDRGRSLITRILQSEWEALAPIAAQFTKADCATAVRVLQGVSRHFAAEAGAAHAES